jgi:pimeloyl-ACP methyl ester carboxylesterase
MCPNQRIQNQRAVTIMSPPITAPNWMLLGSEPVRAAFEYARMRSMDIGALPRGDGHAVVIFPGLAASHTSIEPLLRLCRRLGYAARDWGRGLNTGPRGDVLAWLDDLAGHVEQLTAAHGGKISLIGWSLGGIYAREVAKRLDARVRQVITVGTPFAGKAEHTNAAWIYRLLNGRAPTFDETLMARLRMPPRVPTTSVFSRSDGIVAWQACMQDGGHGMRCVENIEVAGSHCGLGWNTRVFSIIADRLRQPENAWQPYAKASVRAMRDAAAAAPCRGQGQAG